MYLDVENEEVFLQMKTKSSCILVLDDITLSLVFNPLYSSTLLSECDMEIQHGETGVKARDSSTCLC